ncbi:MAG: ABC transporter substrate-binding protein [bacterium]|nr:ABC transporter substrate-binding protein [bacterium]
MRAVGRFGAGLGLGVVLALFAGTGCGLFSEGTVISPAPIAGEDEQPAAQRSPTPTATFAGVPLPSDAVVIGALMATTGFLADYDEPALVAARNRIDALNQAGGLLGRPVVLRHIDSHTEMSSIRRGAERLLLDGVDLVLMTCDAVFAQPALDLLNRSGTVVISPCGTDDLWISGELGERVFSLGTPVSAEAEILAALVADRGFATVTGIIDQTSTEAAAVCEAFEQGFETAGGRVSSLYRYQPTDPSLLEPILAGLAVSEPDAIVFCGTRSVAPEILAPIRAAGFAQPIFSGSAMDGDHWIGLVPGVGDFTMLSYASVYADSPDPNPEVRRVLADYFAATGHRARDGRVITGHDAVEAYVRAVEQAGTTDPEAVAAELARFDGEELVAGPVTFGPRVRSAQGRLMRVITIQEPYAQFERIAGPSSASAAQ